MLTQLTLILLSATALCLYTGWGAARLALPASLQPQAALFVPLIGYAITIYLGYLGVSSVLNLRWSLALLLLIATALNLLAWRRTGRPRPIAALREQAAPIALGIATLLVGVLPLLHYGYFTTIGQGWDTESYLPLAQHLNDYTLARISDAPVSPLRDLVRDPPHISVTPGFSVFQGMIMALSGQSALATFAPLLALLRALGVLAIYVWLRATMGLGRPAALLGAAGASAGALLLWVSYFNFGMQMAAWPLLALGLTLGVAAVEALALPETMNEERRTMNSAHPLAFIAYRSSLQVNRSKLGVALLTGVALAALPATFYPALTIWLPMALALGVARLLEAGFLTAEHAENAESLENRPAPRSPRFGRAGVREAGRLALAALALGLVALALAAPTIADYYEGFSALSLLAQHIGPDRFIAPAETLGLLAFRLPNDGPQPPAALVLAGTALLGLLALAGLIIPETKNEERRTMNSTSSFIVHRSSFNARLRWLAVAIVVLIYLAWLRFGRPYEYGYMKGSAYAGFVAWGLAALGWQSLRAWLHRPGDTPQAATHSPFFILHSPFQARAALLAILALAPLLLAGWAQALTVADHWHGPAIFNRDIAAFDAAAAQIPAGAAVAVTSDAAFAGPISGQLSASLYGREIWGHLSTAYTNFDHWPTGRSPQYAVLAADEHPWPLDYGGQELWRSGAVALYRLDDGAHVLQGRSEFYSPAPPADRGSPAALAIWRRGGAYCQASQDAPLTIAVGETLGFGRGPASGQPREQQVRLTVASLVAQNVLLNYGERRDHVALAPGVSHIALQLATPTELTIAPDERLALIDVVARDTPGAAAPIVQLDDQQIAWGPAVEQKGPLIQLRVPIANPGRQALRIGLTIVEDTFDRPHTLVDLLAAAPTNGTWQLNLDPARGATEALVDSTPTPMLQAKTVPNPSNGSYFAILTIYDGAQIVAHAPVFTLSMSGGKLAAVTSLPFTVEATPVGLPAAPLPGNVRALLGDNPRTLDGQQADLAGALLTRKPAWPGAPGDAPFAPGTPFTVQLFWQARTPTGQPLMISIQALGPDNRKWAQWDGALGDDWRPIQGWQAGDRVRQDVPLRLDPATPPGSYRLALVAYDPASGQPQPFGGENMLQLGELQVQK